MARKTSKKAQKGVQDITELTPEVLVGEHAWEWVAEHSAGPDKPRVWLIGETGVGKTARVRNFAEQHGRHLEVLLLQSMLPEDVLGIPRVMRQDGEMVTVWAKPEWLQRIERRPSVLLLDEVDKPRDEVRAAVLTMLQDYRVGAWRIPSDTIIVLASQPIEAAAVRSNPTLSALLERCWIYPVVPSKEEAQKWAPNVPYSVIMTGANVTPPLFEDLSLRRASWFSRLSSQLLEDGGNEADVFRLAAGFVEEQTARHLATTVAEGLDWSTRVKKHPEVLKRLPSELIPQVQHVLLAPDMSARYFLYALSLMQRAPVDTREAWAEAFRQYVDQLRPGEEVEVFSEKEPEDVLPAMQRYILDLMVPEVERYGGLREDTDEVRDELWRCIVEGERVEPVAKAEVARPAIVQRGG